MSLETKIDIVVKNLNQLNKLADNLKNINKRIDAIDKQIEKRVSVLESAESPMTVGKNVKNIMFLHIHLIQRLSCIFQPNFLVLPEN